MKVITITQPYATLAMIEAKKIETRGWYTTHRGPLLIHAGKGLGPAGGKKALAELINHREPFWRVLRAAGLPNFEKYPEMGIPLGAILGQVTLVDVLTTRALLDPFYGHHPYSYGQTHPLTSQERAFGDYSPQRYGWLFADVLAFPEPIPILGAQGLWDYTGPLPEVEVTHA